jgi:hypothetical protein
VAPNLDMMFDLGRKALQVPGPPSSDHPLEIKFDGYAIERA